jgi:hypothetical protein
MDKKITCLAKKLHLKRSDIVRMAIEKFLGEFQNEKEIRPYEKVKQLIGSVSSGIPDLGEAHRKHLLDRFKKYA